MLFMFIFLSLLNKSISHSKNVNKSQAIFGTYFFSKSSFIIYLKFKFNWSSYVLSSNPISLLPIFYLANINCLYYFPNIHPTDSPIQTSLLSSLVRQVIKK